MSLDVEMECVVESLTAAGVHYVKGDTFAAPPDRAAKLIKRGAAKKVGVIDSETPAEEPVEEEEAEAESDGDESSEEDDV